MSLLTSVAAIHHILYYHRLIFVDIGEVGRHSNVGVFSNSCMDKLLKITLYAFQMLPHYQVLLFSFQSLFLINDVILCYDFFIHVNHLNCNSL